MENNHLEAPFRAAMTARPREAAGHQAIRLRGGRSVKTNHYKTLDPESPTRVAPLFQSSMRGEDGAQYIVLSGLLLRDVQQVKAGRKAEW